MRVRRLMWLLIGSACAAAAAAASGAWPSSVPPQSPAASARSGGVPVLVRERSPRSSAAEGLVRRLGGTVTRELPIVRGFSARVPAPALPDLLHARSIERVWPDARIRLADSQGTALEPFDALPPNAAWPSTIRLPDARVRVNGAGVTVALLDTGVADVPDLGSRVAERVDLTSERTGLDSYGHGTHMAGIIAGDGSASGGLWVGVAPGASLVSVKVAGADGSTDVSVILAGLQWIAANESRLHIRVLNLSFGTDSTQSYVVDPLDYAVEQLWSAGILVVVAAGNRGPASGTVDKPGDDPFALTIGASGGPGGVKNEAVTGFSSRGPTWDGLAKPDLVAPGTSIVSTRAPGSTIDVLRPAAQVGEAYFKGTGTSQAAAVVSGVAALLFAADPALTPDEAKAVLTSTANPLLAGQPGGGAGLVDAHAAVEAALEPDVLPPPANQGLAPSTGLGSLEASRGSYHVLADLNGSGVPVPVVGEIDVLGTPWLAKTWSSAFWSALDWGAWSAASWSGGWDAKTWSAKTWSASVWG